MQNLNLDLFQDESLAADDNSMVAGGITIVVVPGCKATESPDGTVEVDCRDL